MTLPKSIGLILSCALLSACGCSKYASDYSCPYIEKWADYEVWYWLHVENEDEKDNKMIGHATGLEQCEDNARAFAESVGEPFNYRAYMCVLMDDGKRMEKHRNIIDLDL